jgi:hypothetical protein
MSLQSSESDVLYEVAPRTLNVCFPAPMSANAMAVLGILRPVTESSLPPKSSRSGSSHLVPCDSPLNSVGADNFGFGCMISENIDPTKRCSQQSGPSRRLKFGAQIVELRHAPIWQLIFPGRAAGEVVRALAWLGPEKAGEAIRTLRAKLPPSELKAVASARAPADVDGPRDQRPGAAWLSSSSYPLSARAWPVTYLSSVPCSA